MASQESPGKFLSGSSIHAQTHTERVVGVTAHASEAGANGTKELQERT